MRLQMHRARTVSLALELLENSGKEADMVYIYMYQSDTQVFFNTFFAKDKKIYFLNDWFTDDQINDFLITVKRILTILLRYVPLMMANVRMSLKLATMLKRNLLMLNTTMTMLT